MPIPNIAYLQVLAAWPVLERDAFLTGSPWQGVTVPPTDDPLRPVLSVRFNHALDPAVTASDAALGAYFFLTSLTDPGARNVIAFTDVAFDAVNAVLTCRPASRLVSGETYQATLRATIPDADGRRMTHAYSWEFEAVDTDDGLAEIPAPIAVSPADGTAVPGSPFTLTWALPASFTVPAGLSLSFQAALGGTRDLALPFWSSSVQAAGSLLPSGMQNASGLIQYAAVPAPAPGSFQSPAELFWSVTTVLTDASGTVTASSEPGGPFQLLYALTAPLDAPILGPGDVSYPAVRQSDPLTPAWAFSVTAVWPPPGSVVQDPLPL